MVFAILTIFAIIVPAMQGKDDVENNKFRPDDSPKGA
jgi:hypothetical protein